MKKWVPGENYITKRVMEDDDGEEYFLNKILEMCINDDLKTLVNAARMCVAKFPSVIVTTTSGKYCFENKKKKYIYVTKFNEKETAKYVAIFSIELVKMECGELLKWIKSSPTDFEYRQNIFTNMVALLKRDNSWSFDYFEDPIPMYKEYVQIYRKAIFDFGRYTPTKYRYISIGMAAGIASNAYRFKNEFSLEEFRKYIDNGKNGQEFISYIKRDMMYDLHIEDEDGIYTLIDKELRHTPVKKAIV